MKNIHVIIAGAGPAGLTLGLVLQQRNIDFTIIDSAVESRLFADIGGGYDLGANAIKVYNQFGLGQAVKEKGSRFNVVRAYSDKGKLTSTISIPGDVEMASVRRSTLQSILVNKLTTENMLLGSRIVSVDELDDKVTVALDNGREISGDLLIGADGVHSVVRQSVIADGIPTHVGVNCIWGRVDWKLLSRKNKEQLQGAFMMLGGGQSFLAGHMGEQLIWSAFWKEETFVRSEDNQIAKAKAVDRLTSWNEQIAKIVHQSDNATISETAIYDRPAAKSWHSKRTLLIGDAAHPMTPFLGAGANTAIADAFLLGQFIDGLNSIDELFELFEQRRKKPVEKLVRTARTVCDYSVSDSRWKSFVMQYSMSIIPSFFLTKLLLVADKINDASIS
ncbi:FAD-dependent monooxygenase [Gammaproteobacteria bacterium]|nr:FAD-dependent monooxygenase [Gammaproteobacteria bacterium]